MCCRERWLSWVDGRRSSVLYVPVGREPVSEWATGEIGDHGNDAVDALCSAKLRRCQVEYFKYCWPEEASNMKWYSVNGFTGEYQRGHEDKSLPHKLLRIDSLAVLILRCR